MESGGLVLYSKMLDGGTFARPTNTSNGPIEWMDLVMMVEGIVDNPAYRLMHDRQTIAKKDARISELKGKTEKR